VRAYAPCERQRRALVQEVAVKPRLRPIFVLTPERDARRELDAALDTLADAMAEQILDRARAEVCGGNAPPSRSSSTPVTQALVAPSIEGVVQ
jgi:hypothetical protein